MTASFLSNVQVFSIVTSILSFSWSMSTYHVYVKKGALDISAGLTSRILLFTYILLYIFCHLIILTVSAHNVFDNNFHWLLIFLLCHMIIMAFIHILHLRILRIKFHFRSLEFWMETLVNSFGSLIVPSNIKFPKTNPDTNEIDDRYHEPTSLRYFLMHLIQGTKLDTRCHH